MLVVSTQIHILSDREIEGLFELPRFTHQDRMQFFSLSVQERNTIEKELRSTQPKAYCILQLGYFRARQIFFSFAAYQDEDLAYMLARYFLGSSAKEMNVPDQRTRKKHQQIILRLCHFRPCSDKEKEVLREKARQAARISGKPYYVFRILMNYITSMKVDLLGYRWFQHTVSQILVQEGRRLDRS